MVVIDNGDGGGGGGGSDIECRCGSNCQYWVAAVVVASGGCDDN